MHLKLPNFSTASVLVTGDVMLDRYWQGPAQRISPEAPVPVVRVDSEQLRPGGASNVALNIAALGARTVLVGLVGEDQEAVLLQDLLSAQGVECALAPVPGSRTITKLRILSKHQQLIRLDFEDGFPACTGEGVTRRFQAALSGARAVVLSDYSKGALRDAPALIQAARALGLPVVVDPKGTDFTRYAGATVLTPNQSEFDAVAGKASDDADLIARGERLRDDLGLAALLVTRSEKGMTLLERGHAPVHLPTHAREVYDVTGAGDTVVAVLAAALAAGLPMRDAVALSNLAAGVVVGKLGTATVSPEELEAAMSAHIPVRGGVVSEDELLLQVARARAAGERVVMTNGCFDILHAGHVDYLQRARALGDRLIVAVNDDDSVRRLKGATRPINGVEARMIVLAALAAVDWVVPFSEDTPERVICRVTPDLLVKGGDYRIEDIAGGPCVQAAGGEVRVLPFVEGHSTSAIIRNIQKG
ncbi:MAG: bifunctional D-glycero-beta-D-manno-heptose-7-phosphate kinase/D-glycero-beta-D-manno-heptose 1-phosphate adenylyltransferase HldE [Betaproteobacteria bacterium]|nr:bifunctional D-glycero-beta-D-manno-heptose-7-phosphate kinase/D-glycero-beta-D-manno-heptose 1-phosphate adenylyltransferase HldE [Betaproteobacteria bacterium]